MANTTELDISEDMMQVNATDLYKEQQLRLEFLEDHPKSLIQFAATFFSLEAAVGITGNLLTIIILSRRKKLHSANTFFIINLAVADLLLNIFGTTSVAATYIWFCVTPTEKGLLYKGFLLQVESFIRYTLWGISVSSLLAIALNRYFRIVHAEFYSIIYEIPYLKFHLFFLWVVNIAILIPSLFGIWGEFHFDTRHGVGAMSQKGSASKVLFLVFLLTLPFIILFCYISIYVNFRRTAKTVAKHTGVQRTSQFPGSDSVGTTTTSDSNASKRNTTFVKINNSKEDKSVSFQESEDSSTFKGHGYQSRNSFDASEGNFSSVSQLEQKNLEDKLEPRNNVYITSYNDKNSEYQPEMNIADLHERNSEEVREICPTNQSHKLSSAARAIAAPQVTKTSETRGRQTEETAKDSHQENRTSVKWNVIDSETSNVSSEVSSKTSRTSSVRFKKQTHRTISPTELRLIRVCFVVFCLSMTCHVPLMIAVLWVPKGSFYHSIALMMLYLDPCINPIIYVTQSLEYRKAFAEFFMCGKKW